MIIPVVGFCCAQADDGQAWTYEKSGFFGRCKIYSKVDTIGASSNSKSGGPAIVPNFVPKLYPEWPCSSPWVTSVGATRFQQQQAGQLEMASDQFGSGGGFSNMFEAFEDQQAATAAYQVFSNGKLESVGGTSASAPAFAAMISLLNEARLAAGKAPMGYLNPWLYQNPDAFTDITEGTNAIGRGDGPIAYGFNCTKGWDPVTGLGTPIFSKMLEAALAAGGDASITV